MTQTIALAGAFALLLQVIERMFPTSGAILPMAGGGFEQTACIMLGAIAMYQIRTIWVAKRAKGNSGEQGMDGET